MPLFYHGAAAVVKMDYCCFCHSVRCIILHGEKVQKRCNISIMYSVKIKGSLIFENHRAVNLNSYSSTSSYKTLILCDDTFSLMSIVSFNDSNYQDKRYIY